MSLLGILMAIALTLTCAMFASRQSMLGMAAAMFWAIAGGQAYTLATGTWGDIYFLLAFASFLGMTVFCAFAAYGMREKRDAFGDEEVEGGEEEGGEEGKSTKEEGNGFYDDKPGVSKRRKELRDRADERRRAL